MDKEPAAPRCPKCKKNMKDAAFLMMGLEFKCFDCEEVITCHEWWERQRCKRKTR